MRFPNLAVQVLFSLLALSDSIKAEESSSELRECRWDALSS